MEQVIIELDDNGDVVTDSLVTVPRISRHYIDTGIYRQKHKETTCLCSNCGEVFTIYLECGDRTCHDCQERRRKRILERYIPIIASMAHPLFLTLTLTRRPLVRNKKQDTVKFIRDCFTRLRHRLLWKASGGIYQIEIGTIIDSTANVHIHVIIDCPFLSKPTLRKAWKAITQGSYIVDIKRCWSSKGALTYLTTHMGKRIGKEEDADLINHCLHGTRLVQGFGTLRHQCMGVHNTICMKCGAQNTLYLDFEILTYKYPRDNVGF